MPALNNLTPFGFEGWQQCDGANKDERRARKKGSAWPAGRNADEIAKAVAFLASDEASYVAGIELFVEWRHRPNLTVHKERKQHHELADSAACEAWRQGPRLAVCSHRAVSPRDRLAFFPQARRMLCRTRCASTIDDARFEGGGQSS
jgi:hypothetical protein